MGDGTQRGTAVVMALSDLQVVGLVTAVLSVGFVLWVVVTTWLDNRRKRLDEQERWDRQWRGLP